ncbi:MAG: exosortase C-terminal domain/associated protein EpsI [Isosphaeraceae bacterium]
MSVLQRKEADAPPSAAKVAPEGGRVGGLGFWVRVVLVCGVLIGSGLVRARQDERIGKALERGMESPVTLEDIPMTLGPWRGEPTEIDSEIARGTGAIQVVTRRYVNQATGVRLEVILLFGRAVNMYMHMPEICYPAAGFTLKAGPEDRLIPVGDEELRFRSLVYAKGEGARTEHQEVFYSWWYDGQWTPTAGTLKHFERISGMYKLHVARLIAPGEPATLGKASPCEEFLKELLPEMRRRLADRTAPAA